MRAQANNGHQKLSTIDTSLMNNVEERCRCGFSLTNIMSPNFQCFGESEDAVTYRAEITGRASFRGGQGGRWSPLGRIPPPLGIVSLLY